jgi:hypothetical protein
MSSETGPLEQLRERFSALGDPRVERTKLHQLLDIITIAICAVICGADDWVEIEQFGNDKRPFFDKFLVLPNGIPSHDTFAECLPPSIQSSSKPASWNGCKTW